MGSEAQTQLLYPCPVYHLFNSSFRCQLLPLARYSCDVMCGQSPVEAGRGEGTVWRRRDDGAGVCGLESGHRWTSHSGHPHPGHWTVPCLATTIRRCEPIAFNSQLWIAIIVIGLACSNFHVFSCLLKPIYIPQTCDWFFLMFSISILREFNVGRFSFLILVFL